MSPLQIYENWWSLAPNRPGLPYVSQEYVFNIGKQILPTLCLEAAPRTAQIPHKVISSCQPGDFPGPVSWSELLWAKFASLAHRQLIHPLFFFFLFHIPHDFPQLPLMSVKVGKFSYSSLWKSHTLDQSTAVQRNMSAEDIHRKE